MTKGRLRVVRGGNPPRRRDSGESTWGKGRGVSTGREDGKEWNLGTGENSWISEGVGVGRPGNGGIKREGGCWVDCPRLCSRFVVALQRGGACRKSAGVSEGALGMLPD